MRTTSPTTRTIPSKRRRAAADKRNSRRSVQAMRRWSGDRTARARFPRRAAIALRIARSRTTTPGKWRHGAGQAEFAPLDTGDTAAIVRQRGTRDCAPRGDCFPDRTESRQIGRDSRQPLSNRCHAHDGACTMREKPSDARSRTSTQRFRLEGARRRVGWVRSGIAADRSRGRAAVTGRRSDGRGAAERARGAMLPSRGVRPEQT